ncbi:MAG: carbon-monoxide dehydrogenase large subunit, partial [Gammaproteobacteria bacterium]
VISYAVTDLIALATRRIANVQSIDEDHIHFSDGLFQLDGRNLALSWRDVAQLEVADNEDDDNDNHNDRGALWVRRDNNMPTPVFPNGCAVCEVEVDPETGHIDLVRYAAVDDVGRAINPMILHGQAHGSIAQGVGQALGEQVALDAASGQTLTGSLLDYTIPRADTVPTMDVSLMEVLSPTNPLGIKSGGEGATTPALAVVVNAVVDALAPLGVEHIEMPLTPLRIYETIRDARAKHLSEKA